MTTRTLKVVERMTFWPDQFTLEPPTVGETEPPPPKENDDGS